DNEDRCPKTPGPASNDGCPELEEEEKEIMQKAFDNLEFESGKAVIKAGSLKDLDKIADILKDRPDAILKIEGHTDATGSDALNMRLSKERAMAVKDRLTEKGVGDDRFFVNWYGETRPIEDNSTAEGRKANRRVELQIIYE
ncbi:MAG: OmpA family protein, partial [Chitinophagales bacterium]